MATSTTVRIKTPDKHKLDELCKVTHCGISDMLTHLITEESDRMARRNKRSRKAG